MIAYGIFVTVMMITYVSVIVAGIVSMRRPS